MLLKAKLVITGLKRQVLHSNLHSYIEGIESCFKHAFSFSANYHLTLNANHYI